MSEQKRKIENSLIELKTSRHQILQSCDFFMKYNICIACCFVEDDLFSSNAFFVVSTASCDKVTTEEKARLINEAGFLVTRILPLKTP